MLLIRLFVFSLLSAAAGWACANAAPLKSFSGDEVLLLGRFDLSHKGEVRFTWPGSAVAFRFRGTQVSMAIDTNKRVRFDVAVDGRHHPLWVVASQRRYTLAKHLINKSHSVRVTRLGESFVGVTAFTGGPITDGQLLPRPQAPARKLLIIGDSISAGYGVEGTNHACHFSQATENPLKAYGSVAARQIQAQVHTIAWSGIGAWRSYGEHKPQKPTIGIRRQLTLATDLGNHWDSKNYQPAAVVIAIGTNDFWQSPAPGYLPAMKKLVAGVQRDYPQARLYLMVSPMLSGAARKTQKADLQSLTGKNLKVIDLGKIQPADGYGCDYHPNTKTQRRLGERLARRLQQDLGW